MASGAPAPLTPLSGHDAAGLRAEGYRLHCGVCAAGRYRVRSGALRRELALREADVRAGATVGGPSLR